MLLCPPLNPEERISDFERLQYEKTKYSENSILLIN